MLDNVITINSYYRVVGPGDYSWPHPNDYQRKLFLRPEDVLLKASDGTYQLVSGVVHSGIRINDERIAHYTNTIQVSPIVE